MVDYLIFRNSKANNSKAIMLEAILVSLVDPKIQGIGTGLNRVISYPCIFTFDVNNPITVD